MHRCIWANSSKSEEKYHDEEWGVPVYDSQKLFRKLILDMNQAGLSWSTILNKSDNFDAAYDNFNIEKIAHYDEAKITELMQDAGIIRNRRKIEAAINNAQKVLEMEASGLSFSDYIWEFTQGKVIDGKRKNVNEVPVSNELSDEITKDLKKKGFKFVGSTTIYAFLQAVGIINDHEIACFRYREVKELERNF
ncbi:DNA-3-methyladenine glycosylase I [Enterococcus sp. ALS3]|uniref:DNA-3-methyladenine glycosylase I n=1 Tax=Enterococcus alishanensis TaxID=1303817 RepID=A0ABS6T9K8_9ENTE|nr:DNA-3-methyladenine glycosylase I [Enterococcus alishanensis]MBV7389592.1 DNA-3-methyladenine glycosylase I [Enterococcus alishanensis]